MPQATDALRAKFPGGDTEAWSVLANYCVEQNGRLRPKSATSLACFGDREWDAVTYLCDEWDYSWDNKPADEAP